MPLNLEPVQNLLNQLKTLALLIVKLGLYAGLILIVSDLLLGTSFGVLARSVSALAKIGITGNVLTVLVLVGLGIIVYRKQ